MGGSPDMEREVRMKDASQVDRSEYRLGDLTLRSLRVGCAALEALAAASNAALKVASNEIQSGMTTPPSPLTKMLRCFARGNAEFFNELAKQSDEVERAVREGRTFSHTEIDYRKLATMVAEELGKNSGNPTP